MSKFVVIGLGVFGRQVALTLAQEGAEVIAVDSDMERVEELHDYISYSVKLDSTDPSALRSLGLQDMDAAIVAIGENFEANLLTAAYLKQLGVEKVITRASNPIHRKILEQIGADEIISPEDEVGKKTAHRLLRPNLVDYLELGEDYNLIRVETPKDLVGKTLGEIDFRKNYHLNIVSIHKREVTEHEDGETVKESMQNAVPDSQTTLEEGNILVIAGKDKDIERFTGKFL
ncbi:MAG: TrkA family potassium uptake protein [Candidatus Marinimicrobia bacterium]|nr:TrkA family potassium uptake protein [Candidatus Neomarinimicrobiota bacterium]MCF7828259.1 TrkA family potassium uptake protein [Candidatus Neomarinimicrobiota bacterium]MCF7879566.1 TrkA family potassium uptake protein [Candidatus Neomarinimicrobiota bacterium]